MAFNFFGRSICFQNKVTHKFLTASNMNSVILQDNNPMIDSRSTWVIEQLDPQQFIIRNPGYKSFLQQGTPGLVQAFHEIPYFDVKYKWNIFATTQVGYVAIVSHVNDWFLSGSASESVTLQQGDWENKNQAYWRIFAVNHY